MSVELFLPHEFPPGEKQAEAMRRLGYMVKSAEIDQADLSDGANTVALFNVPANVFVREVIVQISEVWNGTSPSATIGDGDDPDRFLDATALAVDTLGYYSSKQDTQPGSGGHVYSAADTIDAVVTITAADNTTGKLVAWLIYTPHADKL